MDIRNILWYVLNPLIIVELMGNVHFEGIMICFLVAFLYYLFIGKYKGAAIFWTLAIGTKIIPLILAPVLVRKMGIKKFAYWGTISAIILFLLFIPFVNVHLISDYKASIKLFYHLFECYYYYLY